MKKVIFNIVQSNVNGGLENVYLDYTKILSEDYDVVCITSSGFVHLEEIRELGVKTEILNIKGHYDILSVIKFFFLCKKYSPKIVVAHNGRSFSILNLYNKIIKNRCFKTIAVCHGGNPKRLINFDYIITVARHLTDKIKRKYKTIDKEKIVTIHNGIEINRKYNSDDKAKNKEFTFGTLSRLSPEKNIITAIKAFKIFLNEIDNAKLIIAGEGPSFKDLNQFIKKENLQDNVFLVGYIDDIKVFFNKIDVLLHPACEEPFGLIALEAFNYYTPIISSNMGGLKEIIENKKQGYLYEDPMSFQNLYAAMHNYYFHEIKNKQKVTTQARKHLEDNFSIAAVKNKLKSLIDRVIKTSL